MESLRNVTKYLTIIAILMKRTKNIKSPSSMDVDNKKIYIVYKQSFNNNFSVKQNKFPHIHKLY